LSYAATDYFAFRVLGSTIEGEAAPTGGKLPCLIGLYSEGIPIAFGRATRHSPTAANAGLRHGWCGFEIPGAPLAKAIGNNVELRCGVTDRILGRPDIGLESLETVPPTASPINVFELVDLAQAGEDCPNVETFAAFGRNHLQLHGVHSFLHSTYQMLFGRDADNDVIGPWVASTDPLSEVEDFLNDLLVCEEFLAKPFSHLPGPFQDTFRYDTSFIR
jgi:hypothetical protein